MRNFSLKIILMTGFSCFELIIEKYETTLGYSVSDVCAFM